MTRGVRADRVGVVLSHRRSQERAGGGPWPVKPRLVAVDAVARGLGLVPHFEQRCPYSVQGASSGEVSASSPRYPRRPRCGWAPALPCQADAGERGERGARAHAGPHFRMRGGDRTVGGRARGSSWLQKSTSGAWSWPKGHGSSPLAMEGVLERCGPSSLTRRRPGRSRRPEAMGMRQRCRIRRGRTGASEVMSQARPAVENTAGGRFGAEEPSIGAPPGLRWTAHATLRGSRDGCSNGRSWRFAVKRSSTWLAHPASGSVDLPDLSGRRLWPRVSPCWRTRDVASVTCRERDRESSDPQGARDGSRLQKSVRRIFLVA